MLEVIKKHFMSQELPKTKKKRQARLERFEESLANGYAMGMLSGIYSVENL